MRINHAGALLAVVAMTSQPVMATPNTLDGVWGGPGAVLTIGADGGVLQRDCASGRFGPVRMLKTGAFRARGTWEEHTPGPQAADVAPAGTTVMFEGRVNGETMALTITRPDQPRQTITLLKGKRAKLIRCL